ncbi:MAG TPA: hypothetical protein VG433_14580, partial [Pirellulales bacterium]|nr:hypothetical protein [Pirellulales bacterium]
LDPAEPSAATRDAAPIGERPAATATSSPTAVAVSAAPTSLASVQAAVAATAAELSTVWPTRFAADAPTLLDDEPMLIDEGPMLLDATPAAIGDVPMLRESERTATPKSDARPLSTFAPALAVIDPTPAVVRPLLEVDRFLWPADCDALCASSHAVIDAFAARLRAGAAEGRRRVALIAAQPSAGRTTVALSLARRAAMQGGNWVVVDADLAKPELAARLGIVPQLGWSQVIAGQQELAEVMIASVEDRLAIVPLDCSLELEQVAANYRVPAMFEMLADAYDLVLVDAGAPGIDGIGGLAALHQAARWDAAYVVYDARSSDEVDLVAYCRRLTAAGLPVTGGIENFGPTPHDIRI